MLTLPRCLGKQSSMRANYSALISISAVSPLMQRERQ